MRARERLLNGLLLTIMLIAFTQCGGQSSSSDGSTPTGTQAGYAPLNLTSGNFCHACVFGPFDGCCQGHGGSGAGPGICPADQWLFNSSKQVICADGYISYACVFSDPSCP